MTRIEKAQEIWQDCSFIDKYEIAKKFAERNNYEYPEECTEEVINRYFPTAWDLYCLGDEIRYLPNFEYIRPNVGNGFGKYTRYECEKWCDEMFEEQLRTDDPEDIFGLDWDFDEDEDEDEE